MMVNSLDIAMLNQFEIDRESPLEARRKAAFLFSRTNTRSAWHTADFDGAFHPLKTHNRDRWIGIVAARRQGTILPPVDLIQVGDSFYVRDGNHRVSLAKAAGQVEIEAQILYALY